MVTPRQRLSSIVLLAVTLTLAACGGGDAPPPETADATDTTASEAPARAVANPGTDVWIAPLSTSDGLPSLGALRNVTDRPGYDNQPHFLDDGSILYTRQDGERTDIWRWDPATDRHTPVTRTDPESEYSPTPLPAGDGFAAIRVEADSTQRLWRFAMDGSEPEPIFPDLAPVGYQGWLDADRVAVYILGSPATLQVADRSTGEATVVAENVGRSIQPVPGRTAVSFTQYDDQGGSTIRIWDPEAGTAPSVAPGIEGGDFHAWTPGGVLLQAHESRIYAWAPGASDWAEIADLSAQGLVVTRMAVSPDGTWIALVAQPAESGS